MRAILLARCFAFSLLLFSVFTFAAEPLLIDDFQLVPLDGSPQGRFGTSVDIDGDVAVVGATDGAGMPEQGRRYRSRSTVPIYCDWKRMASICACSWMVGR